MSSAPIGENSVVSSAIVVTPCPLLKVPADHNPFHRKNMMPTGEALVYGIYGPSHGPFLDQLRRTHLLRASVNRSLSADAPGLKGGIMAAGAIPAVLGQERRDPMSA